MAQPALEARISGTGRYLPVKVLTNADLEKMVDTSDEWIVSRTGIRQRRLAAPGENSSDMAVEAARKALEAAGLKASELDAVVNATITPDYPWPATACIIQEKLGASRAFAFDLSAACSGFVYGLAMARGLVAGGSARRVLVTAADRLSSMVDWTDRGTCVLFGDGSGAAVVEAGEGPGRILSAHLGSDGSGLELLYQPAGGTRMPASPETLRDRMHHLRMNGREVFKFSVKIMAEAASKAMEQAGWKSGEASLFIPHQANLRIIEAASKRLGLPMDKVFVNVDRYGNTSAASGAIALDEAREAGRIREGDKVVLVAFGAGLSWGAVALEF